MKKPRNSLPRNKNPFLSVFLFFLLEQARFIESSKGGEIRERLYSRERYVYRDEEILQKSCIIRETKVIRSGDDRMQFAVCFGTLSYDGRRDQRLVKNVLPWNWGKMNSECYPTAFPPAFNRASEGALTFDRNRFIDGSNMKLRLVPTVTRANNLKLRSAFG